MMWISVTDIVGVEERESDNVFCNVFPLGSACEPS